MGLESQLIGRAFVHLEALKVGEGIFHRTQVLSDAGGYAGLLTVQIVCAEEIPKVEEQVLYTARH